MSSKNIVFSRLILNGIERSLKKAASLIVGVFPDSVNVCANEEPPVCIHLAIN
jgi:hypothetical protein